MEQSQSKTKYRISIKTLQGVFLNFTVEEFAFADGYITFIDMKAGSRKWFPSSNSEVYEVVQ
jgi:hypothetical protein